MKIENYFEEIDSKLKKSFELAVKARGLGYDPLDKVEIPIAKNIAERIEGLISVAYPQIKESGISESINDLEKKYGAQDWRIPFIISLEVANEKYCKFSDKKEAMEAGLRIALAYITNGVVSSPLEGFTRLELKKRRDGKEYFALYFAGPIRSAGTTAVCIFVAVADYVRRNMGYDVFDPNEEEIKRFVTELEDFHERITNLQYMPYKEEIEFMAKHLPVQIDGEPSEKLEVTNHKDLDRVETNFLRNGVCLCLGEGLTQKAAKFYGRFSQLMQEFGMGDWKFLEDFVSLQKKLRAKKKDKKEFGVEPDYNYIKDIVAGRPVLTYPLEVGGFRLRYGRARNSGLSSTSIHPATMAVLNNYIASGTQLKVERPGKSTTISVCDLLEGPIVKLVNGDVLFLENEEEAGKYKDKIEEILFLGDILISYGDFLNRAHKLVPAGYNEEWHSLELEKVNNQKLKKFITNPFTKCSGREAIKISKEFNAPLHPRYTYHWRDINREQFQSFASWFKKRANKEGRIVLPFIYDLDSDVADRDPKRVLELLGIPHKVASKEYVVIGKDDSFVLDNLNLEGKSDKKGVLEIVNDLSGIVIRDKSGTFIGARMGRPEKAKQRKLTGSPQALFPVGSQGGKMRSVQAALEKGKVTADFPSFYCGECKTETIYPRCEICDKNTTRKVHCEVCKEEKTGVCEEHNSFGTKRKDIDIVSYFKNALKKINLKSYGEMVKGVRGTTNKESIPENLAKGILRSKNNIYVNKDGTTRYDMTEMAITAFKPNEIGTKVSKLKELGYDEDIYGNVLKEENQVVELKTQDVILPACEENLEEGADKVLFRVANFIDDLLHDFYKLSKFYNLKKKEDLVGHLVIGLSPHTSAGIVGRVIGFSKTQGFYAHPLFHCMMRRDCDGDEASVLLLMDALINFSRKYLPSHRGTTQDSPLVLTSRLNPKEVDDMVYDLDITDKYPLELYQSAMQYKYPWEVNIKSYKENIGKPEQYKGILFTHNTSNINMGSRCSAYKSIPTMSEKVRGQMEIADKIRAVDESDVARLIIDRHFIRDIKGNLRKFSMQTFRCVNCNSKYRRPPLAGICTKCKGKIIFTVSEGSIVKYLEPSLELAQKYDLPPYIQQTLELTKKRIESVFGKEKDVQEGLQAWFS